MIVIRRWVFEAITIATRIATLPCNLGIKYHRRPKPSFTKRHVWFNGPWYVLTSCTAEEDKWRLPADDNVRSYSAFENRISVAHFPLNKSEFHLTVICSCLNRSVCLSLEAPSWSTFGTYLSGRSLMTGDVTHRSCTNVKCETAYINNGIPIDFKGIKMRVQGICSAILIKYITVYSIPSVCTTYIQIGCSCIGLLPDM